MADFENGETVILTSSGLNILKVCMNGDVGPVKLTVSRIDLSSSSSPRVLVERDGEERGGDFFFLT